MEFDALRFREVMGRFATGVSVVTTYDGDRPAGITVNALSSVSLDPPLVMVALDRRRFITPMVRAAGRYAVNVLGEGQAALSDCFAHAPVKPGREAFCGAAWAPGPTGLPLIDGCLATLECTIVETFSAGDHDLFIGRVDSLAATDGIGEPLLFFRRHYLRVEPSSQVAVEGKPEGLMPTVSANGLEIGYDVVGAGPPLVVLHGATSVGREDFAAQLPLMQKAFLVHLPDARGHGRTRWDAADGFEYAWLVDDLLAFADTIGLQTFHLMGFSMGAMTALQFAVRHPERLRTLVVIGITTHREPRASVGRHQMDPARVLAHDPTWAATLARRHDAGQGVGAWQRLLPAIAADIAAQPLLGPAQLHAIDCPTMVVCGDRDPFVPVEHAAGLARQVPGGRLFVAPDCGHEVMVKRPGLFNEAMQGFYRATEAAARSREIPPHDAADGPPASQTGEAGLHAVIEEGDAP